MESFEVLGVFGMSTVTVFVYFYLLKQFRMQGWFYGDFFMEDFPAHLEYTGIFRYDWTRCLLSNVYSLHSS